MKKEIVLGPGLPDYPEFETGIRRAPDRGFRLTEAQTKIALKNALRYIPVELHEKLAPEFLDELRTRGRIYGYRYRPAGDIKPKSVEAYKGKCLEGKAFQVMIDNNLCFDIALYPYELVTYGETGQVCANWMQYRLIMKYLEEMTDEQTLVVESGHPLGLFKSSKTAPRVIITNSMMVGMFDNLHDWEIAAEMGVANYGQMTAGGWMYIGPQGIVHGTFNTLLNAGRMKLGTDGDLAGHLFVSSGLGGMSGAQPKAAEIAGAVSIVAEVDSSRIETRHSQGWVRHIAQTPEQAFALAAEGIARREALSIAYHGNIIDLLEYALEKKINIELLSDQTSCHAVYEGGYCPAGVTFEERTRLLRADRRRFKKLVDESLLRHFEVIRKLVARGTYFFDYGNSFMKAIYDAGCKEISRNGVDEKDGFIWPSYVEDIMGPELFDYGYGPFRWVCLSGKHEDLVRTDQAAMAAIDPTRRPQDRDNYNWIRDAEKNAPRVKKSQYVQTSSGQYGGSGHWQDVEMPENHEDISAARTQLVRLENLQKAVEDGDKSAWTQFWNEMGRQSGEGVMNIATLGISKPLTNAGVSRALQDPENELTKEATDLLGQYHVLHAHDRSIAQDIANGTYDSLAFMGQFAATGGIAGALTKGASTAIASKLGGSLAAKAVGKMGETIGGAFVRTVLSPSTLAGAYELNMQNPGYP